MVNYTNRVVDVMGGPTMGLNTALDQFFSSARALSADTSSSVLRSSFVRDAQGVAQIWVEIPPFTPAWDGVRDRLTRAATPAR